MFDLKCKRQSCHYNKNCNCTAKKIDVSHSTTCKTYEPDDEKPELEERISQPPIRKDIKVGCDADCLFNTNNKCTANGITVQTCETKSGPTCCTFQPQ